MSNNIEVGSIIEGKVIEIKPFGAFVSLNDKKQGLVHISHVAQGFVKDIHDHLAIGDEVKVKVLSIDPESGKVSLSIRETQPKPERTFPSRHNKVERQVEPVKKQEATSLEDKLKEWLKQSNERQAELNKRSKR